MARFFLAILSVSVWFPCWAFGADDTASLAETILGKSALPSGFVVQIGCGDGRLTAALSRDGQFIVHGQEPDAGLLQKARESIRAQRLYGIVAVDLGPVTTLPYADNLADIVVVDDTLRLLGQGLNAKELMRVVRPGGFVWIGGGPDAARKPQNKDLESLLAAAGIKQFETSTQFGIWVVVTKPRPATMGEWRNSTTGDTTGTQISPDELDPTSAIQWLNGPRTGLGAASSAVASAGGRNFYHTQNVVQMIDIPRYARNGISSYIVCRNSYNGVKLWSRPVVEGTPPEQKQITKSGHGPIAASEDILYVLAYGKVKAFNARTGEALPLFADDDKVYNGVDYLAAVPTLCLTDGRLIVADYNQTVVYDAATGKRKWEKASTRRTGGRELVADDGKVLDQRGDTITCYKLDDGNVLWEFKRGSLPDKYNSFNLNFCKNGVVVAESVDKSDPAVWIKYAHALDAADGKLLWTYTSKRYKNIGNTGWYVMMADGLVWVQTRLGDAPKTVNEDFGNERFATSNHWDWVGLNPRTGAVERSFKTPYDMPWGCFPHHSTERFYISGRPPKFIEWKTGEVHSVRVCNAFCNGGMIIANNLFYGGATGCSCTVDAIRGYSAFSSHVTPPNAVHPTRLEKGPAFGNAGKASTADGWLSFRADAGRSCSIKGKSPADLKLLWSAQVEDVKTPGKLINEDYLFGPQVGDVLTQPTVSGELVYVSQSQTHKLTAIEVATGKKRWEFVAGGRLDTPPTIYKGMCLLGCNDGRVYCLTADEGKLVWTFHAAPEERRIVAYGQVESSWPVVGGVLVDHDLAYFVAGRSTASDSGIHLYAVKPDTGEVVWEKNHSSANDDVADYWRFEPKHFQGLTDLLMSDGKLITMTGQWNLDPKTGEIRGGERRKGEQYSLLMTHQIDNANIACEVMNREWIWDFPFCKQNRWANQPYFFGKETGQPGLLAFDADTLYGYYGFGKTGGISKEFPRFQPIVFAVKRADVDKLWSEWDPATGVASRFGRAADSKPPAPKTAIWYDNIKGNLQAESIAVSSDCLYVAGVKNFMKRSEGAFLRVYSVADGKMLKEIDLEAVPVIEGLSLSGGKLFISLQNGKVQCYGGN
jgi:outer membrane protein assembly factor BamB